MTRPEQQVQGAGPLDGGTRRGAFLHLMHAFTPDGTPLGTIEALPWARDDDAPGQATKTRGRARRRADRGEGELPVAAVDAAGPRRGGRLSRDAVRVRRRQRVRHLRRHRRGDGGAPHRRLDHPLLPGPRLGRRPVGGPDRAWTTSARSCWRRRCSSGGRSRSAAGPRRWPARTGAGASRGSRARRSSRSGRSRVTLRAPERTAGQLADATVNAVLDHRGGPARGRRRRWSGSC